MAICCLNSNCHNPPCEDTESVCPNCGTLMIVLKNCYRPIQPIGAGGFGKTYLALDRQKFDEKCVIKQLAPQAKDEWSIQKAKELFEREARGLAELGVHPQIPSLLDYFAVEDNLYLIQEYIDGQTLKEELKTAGIFNEGKIRQVIADLLHILAFVHQHNVIHRDIKPQNIMRRRGDGKIVLIDFGVSKQMTLTTIGKNATLIGSSGYVPREQMETGNISSSCDLYSLGTTCFHLLTGIHPRKLSAAEGYYWVQNWRSHLKQPISEGLAAIFDKLLQVESRYRYQLVDQVLADFERLDRLEAGNIHFLPTVAMTQRGKDEDANAVTVAAPMSSPQSPATVAIEPYRVTILDSRWLWLIGTLILFGLAGTQIHNYLRYRLFPKYTLQGHRDWVNALAIDPGTQTLFSASADGSIEQWNLSGGKSLQTLTQKGRRILGLAIDARGATMISGGEGGILSVWDLQSHRQKATLGFDSGKILAVAITTDGNIGIAGGDRLSHDGNSHLEIWDLANRSLITTLEGHGGSILALAISPDNRFLVSGSADRTIKIWDLATKKLLRTLEGHAGYIDTVAISPDGKILVSGSADRTIKIWNLSGGELIDTWTGHDGNVEALAISPDGKILVSGGVDRQIRFWQLSRGKSIATYSGHRDGIRSLVISSDGRTLISGSADKQIKIWQMP
jgi:WD40 repeat protein/tRNA A-37 threonylcarbamoyl transferase component Bud32